MGYLQYQTTLLASQSGHSLYTTIGQAKVTGDTGMGSTTYTTKVSYTSSFRGVQEGLVAVYAYSQADGSIAQEMLGRNTAEGSHVVHLRLM